LKYSISSHCGLTIFSGQWAPIVGTGLGMVGSLYFFLATNMDAEEKEDQMPRDQLDEPVVTRCPRCDGCAVLDERTSSSTNSSRSSQSTDEQSSSYVARTTTQPSITTTVHRANTTQSDGAADPGGRKKVARILNTASRALAARAHSQFEDSGFNARERNIFPTIPAEDLRNKDLPNFQKAYNTPQPRSRASSFVDSIGPESSNDQGTSNALLGSPRHLSLPVSQPARAVTRQRHSNTEPSRGNSSDAPFMKDLRINYETTAKRQEDLPEMSTPDLQHPTRMPSISSVSPTTLASGGQNDRPRIFVSED
jgi:hypothetical protein